MSLVRFVFTQQTYGARLARKITEVRQALWKPLLLHRVMGRNFILPESVITKAVNSILGYKWGKKNKWKLTR